MNYRQEDIPSLQELEKILKREGKEYSEWVRENTTAYVKKHGDGNPVYTIDKYADKNVIALPTIYEDPDNDKIHSLSSEDKKFIKEQMAKWYRMLQ